MRFSTKNIHVGTHESDPIFGSVVPPIFLSSTFLFPSVEEGARRFTGKSKGMIYSRLANPTVAALEKRVAALEETEMALVTSSGMAAIVLALFHFLKKGDSIVSHRVVYGGTFEFLSSILPKYGIEIRFADFNNLSEIKKNIDNTTKVLYFESPTNPLLEVIDIKKIVSLARKRKVLTVFDNTFACPPMQYPAKLGIDIVVHSLTKYISGHSDLIAGAILGSKKLLKPLYRSYICFGPTLSPFTAYLILRGMETLQIRVKKQCEQAYTIAKFLEKHPKVAKVYYPKLRSHPQYKIAKKQMSYCGSVLSFEVKGGYQAGKELANNVKLFGLAVSLGAVESLIEHPASMTHSEMTAVQRKKCGIKDALIRISVGLEDIEDLLKDLKQALNKSSEKMPE